MEDVLEDTIGLYGDERVEDDSIHYGPLVLTTAPKVTSFSTVMPQCTEASSGLGTPSGRQGNACRHSLVLAADIDIKQKANTLLADHLFSPSLLLAERIERGLVPVSGKSGSSSLVKLVITS